MLELGRRLTRHGLRPTFVSTHHVLSSTPPPGAPFRVAAISDGFDAGGFASCPDPAEYFSRLEAAGSETLRDVLLSEETAAVRVLVYDSHLPWAGRVARAAGVPATAFFS
ncbi:UDP-glucosyltransferase UGT13248-like [Aegilops tauschii subsp. strangulata]|uniref:UDP-glucosyltransferase UGT13248-like n=1 Tax=Aegilops tauschii subsp. strangulata TaxID=200361 RepID=UPI002346B51C